jgi:hypothetical protein
LSKLSHLEPLNFSTNLGSFMTFTHAESMLGAITLRGDGLSESVNLLACRTIKRKTTTKTGYHHDEDNSDRRYAPFHAGKIASFRPM